MLVFDLAIYAKAQEIRWNDPSLVKRTAIRLGEFHTAKSFLAIIGKRFRDAGRFDMFGESGLVAHGSVNAVMDGKQCNRAVYAHKLMYEGLQRLRFESFLDNVRDDVKMKAFLAHCIETFPSACFKNLCESDEMKEICNRYDQYVSECSSVQPTFKFWSTYIDMVALLQFVRATRECDWNMHLNAVRAMLPWFYAHDAQNYARYLPAYWTEMLALPETHAEIYENVVVTGSWAVQQQDKYAFSATAADQTIEQTINRDCKTSGGLNGITLNRSAVARWVLSQSQRAAIAQQCETLAGVNVDARKRKDLDISARKRDEQAISSIINCVRQMVNPFSLGSSNLHCISSGILAGEQVRDDLLNAWSRGEEMFRTFFENRISDKKVSLFDPMKKAKLCTFSSWTLQNHPVTTALRGR